LAKGINGLHRAINGIPRIAPRRKRPLLSVPKNIKKKNRLNLQGRETKTEKMKKTD